MDQPIVRNLEDLVLQALDPKEILLEMPDVGEDADFERARDLPRPIEID